MSKHDDMIAVTQADRNAAADFLESWEPGPEMTVVKLARAFARHREHAAADERARIVAWLRQQDGHGYDDMRVELIEAGEHLKESLPPNRG